MLKTDSPIFLQNMNMIARQVFLLFKKSTTFWDNPRIIQVLYVLCFTKVKISGERLQDQWSSGFDMIRYLIVNSHVVSLLVKYVLAQLLFWLPFVKQVKAEKCLLSHPRM